MGPPQTEPPKNPLIPALLSINNYELGQDGVNKYPLSQGRQHPQKEVSEEINIRQQVVKDFEVSNPNFNPFGRRGLHKAHKSELMLGDARIGKSCGRSENHSPTKEDPPKTRSIFSNSSIMDDFGSHAYFKPPPPVENSPKFNPIEKRGSFRQGNQNKSVPNFFLAGHFKEFNYALSNDGVAGPTEKITSENT